MSAEALARIDAAIARHESQNAGDPFHFTLTNHLYVALVAARALIPEPPTDDDEEPHFHIWSELPCQPGACRMELPTDDEAILVEGEAETFGLSPIRFSYNEAGVLVIEYEPSWETVARRFARNLRPEPITDEALGSMLSAVYTYERECDLIRGDISQEVFGHRGASIPEAVPTSEGRIAAMRAALESALGVEAGK